MRRRASAAIGRAEVAGAAVLLCVLVLAALLADLLAAHLAGFSYDEMDPAASLLGPGAPAIPRTDRSYRPEPGLLKALDEDGSGRVECFAVRAGLAFCPDLAGLDNVRLRLRREWSGGGALAAGAAGPGLPVAEWDGAVGRLAPVRLHPLLAGRAADPDRDGHVSYAELVGVTAFLHLDGRDVAARDRDGDLALGPEEFPGSPLPVPHLLGTDSMGRDLLARLLYGLRISLLVASCATAVSFLLGAFLGLLSGLAGGLADRVFLRVVEVLQSVPFLFVVILLSVLARDVLQMRWREAETQALAQAVVLFCALGAIQWFSLARYARGLAVSLKQSPFVLALEGMGFSRPRTVLLHLAPNALLPLLAYAVLLVPTLVLEEAFLSFLGFGVQPPYPSLGTLLGDGVAQMDTAALLLLVPAGTILALTWSLHVIGEALAGRLAGSEPEGGS